MNIFLAILILFILYLLVVVLLNRSAKPVSKVKLLQKPTQTPSEAENEISILIWNIGYAGLGKNSDFVMDGGEMFFPPSRHEVKQNLQAIKTLLKKQNADFYLLQEISDKSPLSFLVNVRGQIIKSFPNFWGFFRGDILSIFLPFPIRVNHGSLTLSKFKAISFDVVSLPFEPTRLLGLLLRRYGILVSRYKIKNSDKEWVIANLHLAAFDEKGATRQKQIDAVFAFAEFEYKKGNFVILGGDWNMELTKSNFPHKTKKKHLFWRVNFPIKRLPKGWQIGTDKTKPSVRTMNKPYIRGENYTSIIDGYIVSPNVKLKKISTIDTDFKNTDHLPINGIFSTK